MNELLCSFWILNLDEIQNVGETVLKKVLTVVVLIDSYNIPIKATDKT